MYPLLTTLEWHGVARPIGSYGVMLTLALLVGSMLTAQSASRAGLDLGAVIAALAGAVGAGFIGAFGLSVAVLWPQVGSLTAALAQPGVVFYGALVCGAVGLAGWAHAFGLPPRLMLDLTLPALPVAHAIGRIGCLLGGCCYGGITDRPWGVHYAEADVARHPWPLYEASCLLLLAALFWSPRAFASAPGQRAASYVGAYALLRFALEPLRGDAIRGLLWGGSISTSQLISLALALGVCGFFLVHKLRAPLVKV